MPAMVVRSSWPGIEAWPLTRCTRRRASWRRSRMGSAWVRSRSPRQ